MYSKNKIIFFLVFLIFFISPQKIFAVSVDVINIPNTISSASFSVNVSVYGAKAGKNYLRVDLFKEETFNYFGETFNENEWYFGSTGTSYFPIDIISSTSTASAVVQAQIGEPSKTDYLGPGAYKLRIRRYTSASSYSASDSYNVTIDIPTPSPTNAPTASPTKTPTPSPTPTPKPIPTKTATSKPTITPTIKPKESDQPMNLISDIKINEETPIGMVAGAIDEKKSPTLAIIFIFFGTIFLGYGGYLLYNAKNDIKNKTNQIS